MKTQIEINHLGYQVLLNALGFDGTLRFLRQLNPGQGDYTTERRERLDKLTTEDIFHDIEEHS